MIWVDWVILVLPDLLVLVGPVQLGLLVRQGFTGSQGAVGFTGSAGSGGSSMPIWKAKGNINALSFSNVQNDISWNAWDISGGADISLSGAQITISTTGTYLFSVSLRTDNNNRTELFIRTSLNTGSGFSELTDELVSNYVSRDSDQDTGGVVLSTVLELTSGDIIKFIGEGDCDGTCIGLNPGTRLVIQKVD